MIKITAACLMLAILPGLCSAAASPRESSSILKLWCPHLLVKFDFPFDAKAITKEAEARLRLSEQNRPEEEGDKCYARDMRRSKCSEIRVLKEKILCHVKDNLDLTKRRFRFTFEDEEDRPKLTLYRKCQGDLARIADGSRPRKYSEGTLAACGIKKGDTLNINVLAKAATRYVSSPRATTYSTYSAMLRASAKENVAPTQPAASSHRKRAKPRARVTLGEIPVNRPPDVQELCIRATRSPKSG